MLQGWSYHIHDASVPDMVSFSFRIEPVFRSGRDAFKLAANNHMNGTQVAISELEVALGLIRAVNNIADLDMSLARDPAEMERTIKSAADLMARARYDREAYVQEHSQ